MHIIKQDNKHDVAYSVVTLYKLMCIAAFVKIYIPISAILSTLE